MFLTFDELQNAPKCQSFEEACIHILKYYVDVVQLPRIKLRDLYCMPQFIGDAWILPSTTKINTEDGTFVMNKNIVWKLTRKYCALFPLFPQNDEVEVTPLVFSTNYRKKLDNINCPVELQENTFIQIPKLSL